MFITIRHALIAATLAVAGGCATVADLPVRTGTISESQASMRQVFKPSANGAAVGAVAGGVAGNQIGKGRGRKAATVLGVLAGATAGAAMAGTKEMVPTSMVAFRDGATGEVFRGILDGAWHPGMKLRFSVTEDKQIVVR
jgi:outer membrane lipoprotein SlyB